MNTTYTMSTHWRKSPRFRNGPNKWSVGRWWCTSSIGRSSTRVVSKKCFDIRIRTWILAKLMLPIKTKDEEIISMLTSVSIPTKLEKNDAKFLWCFQRYDKSTILSDPITNKIHEHIINTENGHKKCLPLID